MTAPHMVRDGEDENTIHIDRDGEDDSTKGIGMG